MRFLGIVLFSLAILATAAHAQTETPTDAPTATPTITPTPTPRATYGEGSGVRSHNANVRLTTQASANPTPVPMFDYPGATQATCIAWIEVSATDATVVTLSSASMSIDIPFAADGYVFEDWKNRCFPRGEIVSLSQSGTAAVRVHASYFEK